MDKPLNLFCYGSNSIQQLKERLQITDNLSFEKAYIKNYVRIFCGISNKWNGGVSSIYPLKGKNVYGILVKIKMEDLEKLNHYEKGYHLEVKDVNIKNNVIKSFVYVKNNMKFNKLPSDDYMIAINNMLNDRNNNTINRKIIIRGIIDKKVKIIKIWSK